MWGSSSRYDAECRGVFGGGVSRNQNSVEVVLCYTMSRIQCIDSGHKSRCKVLREAQKEYVGMEYGRPSQPHSKITDEADVQSIVELLEE